MLRPWLVIAVAACGHGESAPASAHAGAVTEVAGKVTITHDGRAHDAKLEDVVEADDVVATGADGRVTIVLARNDVPWQLGPGRSSRVADSVAWDLPRRDPNAKPTDQDTATAGRPAERSAANTEVTAARADKSPDPSSGSSAKPTIGGGVEPKVGTRTKVEPSPPPKDQVATPKHVGVAGGSKGDTLDGKVADTAPDPAAADRAALAGAKTALAACFTGAKPSKITIRIGPAHEIARIAPIGVTTDDATKACLAKALATITFASADLSLTLDL